MIGLGTKLRLRGRVGIWLVFLGKDSTKFSNSVSRTSAFGSSGVNFINILCTAFKRVDPKSVKRYWQLDWVLMLWGAMGVKAVRRTLMKLTPGLGPPRLDHTLRTRGRFHQHFLWSFYALRSKKCKKYGQAVSLFYSFGICTRNSCI